MGILFLPARQGRCSGLLFCSAVRPLLLLRPRPRLTPTLAMDTLASEAMEDMEDMVLATAALDTPDLVTLVATDSAMDPLAFEAMEDTADMVSATAALDTPDSTAVATESATEVTPGDTTESVKLRTSPSTV